MHLIKFVCTINVGAGLEYDGTITCAVQRSKDLRPFTVQVGISWREYFHKVHQLVFISYFVFPSVRYGDLDLWPLGFQTVVTFERDLRVSCGKHVLNYLWSSVLSCGMRWHTGTWWPHFLDRWFLSSKWQCRYSCYEVPAYQIRAFYELPYRVTSSGRTDGHWTDVVRRARLSQ